MTTSSREVANTAKVNWRTSNSSVMVDKEGIKSIVNNHKDFASSRLRVNQNVAGRTARATICAGKEVATVITGAHSIIYSTNPEADRAFLRDVLGLTHVDVGGGWLIFALPPAEVAVHPSDSNNLHELYLMCDDIEVLIAEMKARNVACEAVQSQSWGLLTRVALPGGGTLGVYQPRHARPKATKTGKTRKS